MPSPKEPEDSAAEGNEEFLKARFDQLKEQMHTIEHGKKEPTSESGSAMGKAMRMGTEFVVAVLIGAFLGWQLDSWFDTKPILLILFMLFGFGAGINNVMRQAKVENDAQQARQEHK